jgi:penicillin-binding protein 2
VENGGFGSTIAGPIASLMIEKYLRGKITRTDLEKRTLERSLQDRYAKLGGLSEVVKQEMRRKDSLAKSKIIISKVKVDTAKIN